MSDFTIPDGMCVVWTVQCPDVDDPDDIWIDDLVDTEEEALRIIAQKPDASIWNTEKLIVPYTMGQDGD